MHLSYRLPLLTAVTPISLANSWRCWQDSEVSWGKYRMCCLLVRGERSIKFISLSEGGFDGGKKVLVQFLHCCCFTVAMQSTSRQWARSLWHSSSLHYDSSSSCFLYASFSNLFHSAIFASFQAWCSSRSFSSCCQSRASALAHLLANSTS